MEENLGHNAEREIGLRDGGSRGTRKKLEFLNAGVMP
jgi:hypothetical protein